MRWAGLGHRRVVEQGAQAMFSPHMFGRPSNVSIALLEFIRLGGRVFVVAFASVRADCPKTEPLLAFYEP